ncbi:MAG: hypothetical protein QF382_06215, partial [Acidimicrobiales bacterium]|nr:hypothetical protein [Acidimicrobiales bacterium]
ARPCTSSIVMLAVSGREVMVMLLVLRRGIAVAVGVVAPSRMSDAEGYGIDEEGGCSAVPGHSLV